MNSEDRKRIRKQKHRIMMMRLWLPVVLVVVLVVGLTAGGIAMSLGQTKSVAEQGTKEVGTKENETKETSNEPKETGDVNGEAHPHDLISQLHASQVGNSENYQPYISCIQILKRAKIGRAHV